MIESSNAFYQEQVDQYFHKEGTAFGEQFLFRYGVKVVTSASDVALGRCNTLPRARMEIPLLVTRTIVFPGKPQLSPAS